jgi:hypothetical protein
LWRNSHKKILLRNGKLAGHSWICYLKGKALAKIVPLATLALGAALAIRAEIEKLENMGLQVQQEGNRSNIQNWTMFVRKNLHLLWMDNIDERKNGHIQCYVVRRTRPLWVKHVA